MPEHEGQPFGLTQVRQPIPVVGRLDSDDEALLAVGLEGRQQILRPRLEIAMEDDFAIVLRMQVYIRLACRSMPQ